MEIWGTNKGGRTNRVECEVRKTNEGQTNVTELQNRKRKSSQYLVQTIAGSVSANNLYIIFKYKSTFTIL